MPTAEKRGALSLLNIIVIINYYFNYMQIECLRVNV